LLDTGSEDHRLVAVEPAPGDVGAQLDDLARAVGVFESAGSPAHLDRLEELHEHGFSAMPLILRDALLRR
jgi:hypothetical protein